jgi:hypothetical protein
MHKKKKRRVSQSLTFVFKTRLMPSYGRTAHMFDPAWERIGKKLSEINNLIESTKLRFHQESPISQMPADVFISKYNFWRGRSHASCAYGLYFHASHPSIRQTGLYSDFTTLCSFSFRSPCLSRSWARQIFSVANQCCYLWHRGKNRRAIFTSANGISCCCCCSLLAPLVHAGN